MDTGMTALLVAAWLLTQGRSGACCSGSGLDARWRADGRHGGSVHLAIDLAGRSARRR